MNQISPTVAFILAGIFALFLLIYVFAGDDKRSDNPDRLSDEQVRTAAADPVDDRCSSPQTNDLIKAELFRQAATLRGKDEAAMARIGTSSLLRFGSASVAAASRGNGAISCTALMTLDLPPGLSVAGGRHSLPGEATFALQNGATFLTLTGAEEIVTPLATLSRSGGAPTDAVEPELEAGADEQTARKARETSATERETPDRPAVAASPPRPRALPAPAPARASTSPSFNCRNARTRGEIAVCNDGGLASLDRQMASQFYRARSAADPRQRALLERTRGSFLRFRDTCGSQACMANAYRDRMREIDDIMANRWNP